MRLLRQKRSFENNSIFLKIKVFLKSLKKRLILLHYVVFYIQMFKVSYCLKVFIKESDRKAEIMLHSVQYIFSSVSLREMS